MEQNHRCSRPEDARVSLRMSRLSQLADSVSVFCGEKLDSGRWHAIPPEMERRRFLGGETHSSRSVPAANTVS